MTILQPIVAEPPLTPTPLTVDQYHQMIDNGILEEGAPFELLNGIIVRKDRSAIGEDPMTVGNRHQWIVSQLASLDRQLPAGCFIFTQVAISLAALQEPEPDAALILGSPVDYRDRKPSAADILAVIEVADSSLRRDRTTKLRIYAKARIPLYLLINLPEKCIEQYTQPLPAAGRYGHTETLTGKQSIALPLPKRKSLKVSVASLLP